MAEAGLKKPVFNTNGFFRAVFYRPQKVGVRVGEKLTPNQQKMIRLIKLDPTVSAKTLAEKVGISTRKIEENLAKLKQKGLLRRIGPHKGGHWEVLE